MTAPGQAAPTYEELAVQAGRAQCPCGLTLGELMAHAFAPASSDYSAPKISGQLPSVAAGFAALAEPLRPEHDTAVFAEFRRVAEADWAQDEAAASPAPASGGLAAAFVVESAALRPDPLTDPLPPDADAAAPVAEPVATAEAPATDTTTT